MTSFVTSEHMFQVVPSKESILMDEHSTLLSEDVGEDSFFEGSLLFSQKRPFIQRFLDHLIGLGIHVEGRREILDKLNRFMVTEEIVGKTREYLLGYFNRIQELVIVTGDVYAAVRPKIAVWRYVFFSRNKEQVFFIDTKSYLLAKERLVLGVMETESMLLEVDFSHFRYRVPMITETGRIGHGREFMMDFLVKVMQERQRNQGDILLKYLHTVNLRGKPILVSPGIKRPEDLIKMMEAVLRYLREAEEETPWKEFADALNGMGMLPGWGANVGEVLQTLRLMRQMIQKPEPEGLQQLLDLVVPICDVVIVTPHGYFGQDKVLGLPDTGGQVVYILDQVRAMEKEMITRLSRQGHEVEPRILVVTRLIPDAIGTTCNQRQERINGTEFSQILRVPFRQSRGTVLQKWISRFDIWPYLDRFSREVEREIIETFGNRPDLILGNYSDGNLVATLLARRLDAPLATIAHALEMTKYQNSDVFWQDKESQYHFSCQFNADLMAMNAADFVIASTYQEIAGNSGRVGQYESHQLFTMPGLVRVLSGINVRDARFNIVSPGADENLYFSHRDFEKRFHSLQENIRDMLFGQEPQRGRRGALKNPDKPLIFTLARFDRIKNLTGLVEWFGANPRLREMANLVVISGYIDATQSNDSEEREQIAIMHKLMDQYDLEDEVRWLSAASTDQQRNGEIYRMVADSRGIFVQPALYEAFGLTVIEAMSSGLPVFATRFGGPREVIVDGESGFHINPHEGEEASAKMVAFLERCQTEDGYWDQISTASMERVRTQYNWKIYASKVLSLINAYDFKRQMIPEERLLLRRYLEMYFHARIKPQADKMEN